MTNAWAFSALWMGLALVAALLATGLGFRQHCPQSWSAQFPSRWRGHFASVRETDDTSVAAPAVALGMGQIKTGPACWQSAPQSVTGCLRSSANWAAGLERRPRPSTNVGRKQFGPDPWECRIRHNRWSGKTAPSNKSLDEPHAELIR